MSKILPLNKVYIVVFSILAAWAFVAYFTMNSLIHSQEQYGKLINLSGKQRMLSQKTTLIAKRYFESNEQKFFTHLQEIFKLMQDDHHFIISHLDSEKMKNIYFSPNGLNIQVNNYFKLLEDFLKHPTAEQIGLIQNFSYSLLPQLNEAVYAFEAESNEKIDFLQKQELFILIGTLLTLLLEAIFLVKPVVKFVNAKNQELEKIVNEKTKRLQILARVFENAMEGMMITDKDGNIMAVNKAFTNITGYSSEDVLGKMPSILKSGKHEQDFYKKMWTSLDTNGYWQGEIVNKTKEGKNIYEWVSIIRYIEKESKDTYFISVFYDITEQHEAKKHLEYVATHDYLTKLPNRNLFNDRLEQSLATAQQYNTKVALVFIDLDNFKTVNDTLGHDKGDILLQQIANNLQVNLQPSDTIARVGGDEFALIIQDITDIEQITPYIQSIMKKLNETIFIDNHLFNTTASIGVSVYPDDSHNSKELLQFADNAMYHSKGIGKNNFSFFTQQLSERIHRRLEIEQQLKYAIENNEFELFIQPKINILENKISGGEALIRWRKNEVLGPVFPDQFIPIAEDSNQIHLISRWVCAQANGYLERWSKMPLLQNLHLAINISAKEFGQEAYINDFLARLKTSPNSKKLIIEITENMIIEDMQSAIDILHAIHQTGAKIAIDDFGTGYSSLNYLQKLPLDNLKVDKSFVLNIPTNTDNMVIVKTIVNLAHSLGISVVAEGVETLEQLNFMVSLKCEEVQGYYYAPPMALEEFERWAIDFTKKSS